MVHYPKITRTHFKRSGFNPNNSGLSRFIPDAGVSISEFFDLPIEPFLEAVKPEQSAVESRVEILIYNYILPEDFIDKIAMYSTRAIMTLSTHLDDSDFIEMFRSKDTRRKGIPCSTERFYNYDSYLRSVLSHHQNIVDEAEAQIWESRNAIDRAEAKRNWEIRKIDQDIAEMIIKATHEEIDEVIISIQPDAGNLLQKAIRSGTGNIDWNYIKADDARDYEAPPDASQARREFYVNILEFILVMMEARAAQDK